MCESGLCLLNPLTEVSKCVECDDKAKKCPDSLQQCQGGKCVYPKFLDGTPCAEDTECMNNNCTENVCVGTKVDGTYCFDQNECASGLCHYHVCGGEDFINQQEQINLTPNTPFPKPDPVTTPTTTNITKPIESDPNTNTKDTTSTP
jgi:hypothetical protein